MSQTFLTSSQKNLKLGYNHGLVIPITLKWYLKQKCGQGTNREGNLLVRIRVIYSIRRELRKIRTGRDGNTGKEM